MIKLQIKALLTMLMINGAQTSPRLHSGQMRG